MPDFKTFILKTCESDSCKENQFSIEYKHYFASQNLFGGQNSGAYIFRPALITKKKPIPYSHPKQISVFEGKNIFQISVILPFLSKT